MRRVGSIVLVLALFVTAAVVVSTRPVQAAPDIGPAPGPCPQMALGPFPPNHAHCTRTSEHASVTTDVGEVTDGTDITFTMQLNSPPCRASIADRIYPCVQSIGWDYAASTGIGYRLSVPNGTVFRLANGSIVTQSTQPGPGARYYQPFTIFAQPNTVDEHGNIPDPTCIYGEPSPEAGIRCKSRIEWNPGIGPLPAQAWVIAFPSVIIATAEGRADTVVVETAFKFTSTPPPTPLSADFSATQFGKAEFQFSPTVSGGKTPYAYHWDYGDGQTSEGALGGVLYSKPGRYFVTMTVTDGNGDTTHATHDVLIPAPELSVFTRLANGQPTPVKPGDTVDVELVVTAGADGFGDLTDVHFVDDPLFYDADRLELVSGPDPLIPPTFTLQPGEEEVFKYRFNAVAAGHAALTSEVAAVDGADRSVGDTSDGEIEIKDNALVVTLTADPAELVQPEEQGQPPTAVDITVTIKLENIGDDDLTQVNLRSFGGERTQAGQLLPIEQTDGPVPDEIDGLPLASIPAGESITLVAHFHTDDDADIEFSALATASFNGNRVDALGKVKVAIKAKYLLEFTSRVTNPPAGQVLDAGVSIRLEGTVKNLSNSAHLRIGPLYPELGGNAGIAAVKVEGEAPDPRDLAPPEFFDLDPGQTKSFSVKVMTGYSDPTSGGHPQGGTRATIQFRPWGIATLPDGTEVPVDGSRLKASDESLAHLIHINDSIELPSQDWLPWGGAIMVGTVEGIWSAIAALPDMAIGLIKAPYTILSGLWEFQAEVWSSFTDEEKGALGQDAGFYAASILMRNAELGKQKFEDLWAQANKAALDAMNEAEKQWATGDWTQATELYSKFMSEQVTNVVLPIALAKLAKSPAALAAVQRLTAEIQEAAKPTLAAIRAATQLDEVVPLLAQLKSGAILTLTDLAQAFGISEAQAAALQRVAEEFKVVLVMRSRLAESLQWIEKFGAVLKPEALKIKVVNSIDKLLGYADGDIGRLIFKKPLALAEAERTGRPVSAVMDELLAQQGIVRGDARYYQAFQRLALRTEEWLKYEDEYKRLAGRGYIDVGFNYQDNAIPTALKKNARKYRGFKLAPVSGASSEEYVLQMTNGKGEFVSITGDIDGFSFTHADGSPLTAEEHLKVLEALKDDFNIQLQHGQSDTYLEGGIDFLAKQSKGEAMVQFAPGQEPRAVRFNAEHSDWANPRDYHLKFDGGIVHAGAHPTPPAAPSLPDVGSIIEAPPPKAGPPPTAAMLVGRDGNGPMAFGRCNLHYSTEPGARALRVEPDGTVTELVDGSWEPTDLGETCWDDGPPFDIAVLPVTSLPDGSAAGATELAIDTDPGYTPPMGAVSGFQVGQTITIDPGTPAEESAVLVGFGSLLVDRPLRLAHAADAPVVGAVFTAPATAPPATSAGTVAGVGAGSAAIGPKLVTRVAGDDRIATAVAVSRRSFPASQSASAVVLARADAFADALAGTPLAARKDAPLLLTASDSLDPRTLSEIQRVLAPGKTVFVLGGSAALFPRVEAALTAAHYVVVRLGGEDRFATAVTIAHDGLGDPATLLVADGRGFPDALSAGTAAAKAGGAVLLSNGASPAPATSTYLSRRGGLALIAVGGPAAAAYPSGERIVGADRYDTSQLVASRFFTNPTTFGLASGTAFPDALSGGAGVARSAAPILLTAPSGLPTIVRQYLGTNATSILGGVLFGGDAAVNESPRVDAQDAIRGLR